MQRVIAVVPPSSPAILDGYARYRVLGKDYPAIVPLLGRKVYGTLYERLSIASLRLLDRFEGHEYRRHRVRVAVGDRLDVFLVRYRKRLTQQPWAREAKRQRAIARFTAGAGNTVTVVGQASVRRQYS